MRLLFVTLFGLLPTLLYSQESFKTEQRRYPRVRTAYAEKQAAVQQLFREKSIDVNDFSIYLRAFKDEQEIELWVKNKNETTYQLLKTYPICSNSGTIGPKREQGDLQVPEGFYKIDRFNPSSSFYLSLGINYPNKSDRILGVRDNLGGDIFIHGNCVTIGCLPITDDLIKELYIICVEAKRLGQNSIPVTIFPLRLTDENFNLLKEEYTSDKLKLGLWSDLKNGFDSFNKNKTLPAVSFLDNGRHTVK